MMDSLIVEKSGRVDKILSQMLNESRNQTASLIEKGCVKVNGDIVTKTSLKLKEGDKIEYFLPQEEKSSPKEIDFDIEILYEDDDILIINKPAGLVVHPAPSLDEATVVDWLKHKGVSLSTLSGEERHGIVHRIDRGTSGALAIAKSNEAHRRLAQELKNRDMGRYYLAIIEPPLKDNITVSKPIGRNPKNRLKMAVIESGREAKTDFVKLFTAKDGKEELISAKLYTGRTHQIRVHLNSIGRYIVGDELYGSKKKLDGSRVFLHAYIMYLTHPISGERLSIKAPIPKDMQEYLNKKFDRREIDEKSIQKSVCDAFDIDDANL